jgi:hypothetical protein
MAGTQENKMVKAGTDDVIVATTEHPPSPLVVDLGSKSRKQIKRLRNGRGKLLAQVEDCVDDLKATGDIAPTVQPILVVVKQKRKKKMRGLLPF